MIKMKSPAVISTYPKGGGACFYESEALPIENQRNSIATFW